jgi:dTDP-6-deoxy-L-talose 4-dehydrogenase (NAD+)
VRIAMTGATGFIGRHVAAALDGRGVDVVAMVRAGRDVTPLPRWIQVRAMDLEHCGDEPFDRLGSPDTLIHLAWGGLQDFDAHSHLDSELPRQRRFLEACVRGGLEHLLVTGTCLEYGMREGELHEDMHVAPATAYARAKNDLRQELMRWCEELGIGLTWLRVFYLYGAGQARSSLYAQFNAAVDRGDERFPMSPGDQVRDFLPVQQAARTIVELAMSCTDAGVVNLCSGTPVTVLDLVRQWLDERQSNMVLDTGRYPYPAYEPFAFWGSRRKLDRLLGTTC